MPYYPRDNLLFIHIPKTGGMSIEKYFSNRGPQTLLTYGPNGILPTENNYRGISLQHQFLSTIEKYKELLRIPFDDNLKIISIVRNPYNRIISDLFFFNLITNDSTTTEVYHIIESYINTAVGYDNHNEPQYKFITIDGKIDERVHIMRTEHLNKNMKEIGYTDFKWHLNKNTSNKNYYNFLNEDSIKLINEYYSKDFEIFGYRKV